jgi:hypothetical protein
MTVLSRIAMEGLPPRLRAELEELDQSISTAADDAASASSAAKTAQAAAAAALAQDWQPSSDLLASISDVPQDVAGVIEIVQTDQAAVRPIDTDDADSLATRGGSLAFAGKGPTSSRPALGSDIAAIYFDTTLAASGKPIWWTTAGWVDATGAAV